MVTEDGKGVPLAVLTGCPFGTKCAYKAGASSLLKINLDELVAEGVPLTEEGGKLLCPDIGAWDATYLIEEYSGAGEGPLPPLYLTALP